MSCLHNGLSKQDQSRVLGGSSRVKEKYCTEQLTTTQCRNEQNLLDSWPSLITSAQHTPDCIQLSVFTAAQHSLFFQTRTILKTALSKRELDTVPP